MKQPSIADLLKVVQSNKEDLKPIRQNVNDVHRFIDELGIKEGSHRVRRVMIYRAYLLWGGKRTRKSFMMTFSKYFEPLVSGHDFYHYKINYRAVELMNKVDKGLIKI